MKPETYHEIISGDRRGGAAVVTRLFFGGLSKCYSFGVGLRNMLYDMKIFRSTRVGRPVISVGNITAGGTGKTPCVIYLVEKLKAMGAHPAVLTRGYGSRREEVPVPANVHVRGGRFGEEVDLLAHALPSVPIIVDSDRRRGARLAIDRHHADVLVLDDGFQHRRIARDLDIVLIDAICPFGYDAILPRGLLREDPGNIKRASMVILTHADQVGYIEITGIKSRMRSVLKGKAPILAVHRPVSLESLTSTESFDLEMVHGQKVLAYCAIGNGASFRATVEQLEGMIIYFREFRDHHNFTEAEITRLQNRADQMRCTFIVVTEKDAVKLRRMPGLAKNTVAVKVAFEVTEGEEGLEAQLKIVLDQVCVSKETSSEPVDTSQ